MNLSIAKEFSETPGPRSPDEGDFSGELFLELLLLPRYREATDNHDTLVVDLDGTDGYATSFLEAAFGGLARIYDPPEVAKNIELKSDDEPFLIAEIRQYIADARRRPR